MFELVLLWFEVWLGGIIHNEKLPELLATWVTDGSQLYLSLEISLNYQEP